MHENKPYTLTPRKKATEGGEREAYINVETRKVVIKLPQISLLVDSARIETKRTQ